MGLLLAFQHYISYIYIYISIPYVTPQIPFKAGRCLSSPCRYEVVEGWQLPMAAHRSAGPQWSVVLVYWNSVSHHMHLLTYTQQSYRNYQWICAESEPSLGSHGSNLSAWAPWPIQPFRNCKPWWIDHLAQDPTGGKPRRNPSPAQ